MNSRLFKHLLLLILITIFGVSCNDRMPYRETITPDKQLGGGTTGGNNGDDDIERPSGAILFKADFCGCKNGKAITFGNCSSFCSSKNTNGAEVLYANFNVTEDISLNASFGSVHGWCNNLLPEEQTNPRCVLEAKDEDGNIVPLDVSTSASGKPNSITSTLNNLTEDKTYVLTLVESISGARSNSVQIVKYSGELVGPLGPLKNAPISQYTCLYMPGIAFESGDIYYDQAFRIHFYFLPSIPPSPIPSGTDIRCHNFQTYGLQDDPLYPRLELIPGIFNLWSSNDYRFYDNSGNGNEDVNDLIIQKAKNLGLTTIPPSTKFFQQFPLLSTVEINEDAGNNVGPQSMGWYMAPWIDTTTYKSYCLNSEHFNSSNLLFQAMKDIIGVDTEGIYIGVKDPESFTDRDGNIVTGSSDFLLIRETDLKAVWFYLNNGVPTAPTDANVDGVPVYFYYPLNKITPFVKSSTQKTYRVRGANELNSNNQNVNQGGSTPGGTQTSFPPHDRKIGCIPKF